MAEKVRIISIVILIIIMHERHCLGAFSFQSVACKTRCGRLCS